MKKLLIALLLLPLLARAGDLPDLGQPAFGRYELSPGQLAAETAYLALWYVDYRQTMDIKNYCLRQHPGGTRGPNGIVTYPNGDFCVPYESNLLLGSHPSDAKIRNYFLGLGIAHVAVTKVLPTEYRPYWLGAGIAVQLYTVIKNKRMGLTVNF
jgi:hypothetical protein